MAIDCHIIIKLDPVREIIMTDINTLSCPPEINDEDIFSAMRSMEGYIDITPADFKEFYLKAYKHASNQRWRISKR
ncbi:MAG: hypothetical protein JW927_16760 [Deltaproteobacteria bacterium]|nr:hypothetical protein [Deltaproteobacteria bacterium]